MFATVYTGLTFTRTQIRLNKSDLQSDAAHAHAQSEYCLETMRRSDVTLTDCTVSDRLIEPIVSIGYTRV